MAKEAKNRRLREARVRAGLSLEQVGEVMGVHHTAVGRLETSRPPNLDELKVLAKLYQTSIHNLIDDDAPFIFVNIHGKVAAGDWRDAARWQDEDQEKVPYMPRTDRPLPDGALTLEGDSMNEEYPHGSVLFYKLVGPYCVPASGHHVIVKRCRGDEVEVTCKELRILANGNQLLFPRSTNPAFQDPLQVGEHDGESVEIWAIVLSAQKPAPGF